SQALVLRIDPGLQPVTHLPLPVVAGFDRQLMLTQCVCAPTIQTLDLRLGQWRLVPNASRLLPLLLRYRMLGSNLRAFVPNLVALAFCLRESFLHCLELAPQLLQCV